MTHKQADTQTRRQGDTGRERTGRPGQETRGEIFPYSNTTCSRMDFLQKHDSLVKILPLWGLNTLLHRKHVLRVRLFIHFHGSAPFPDPLLRQARPPAAGTHPEHGAVLEHVALVADHTVLVQHGDPLLRELDGLHRAARRNNEGKVTRGRKTHAKLKYFYGGWGLCSYLNQETTVSYWNAFGTICL